MNHLFALLGVAVISFSPIFVRLAAVSPTTAAFFRSAYAIPVLLLLWLATRRRDLRSRRLRALAFGSGLVLAFDLSFWHRSIELIGAGLATVLGNTQVVFVALAAWIIHRERPRRLTLFLVPEIFLGAALISGLGLPGAYGADPVRGVFFGIATGISFAGFLLVFRASNRKLAPAVGPLLDATVGAAAGSLLTGLFDPGFALAMSWPAHGWLVALALGSQVLGWLLISIALPRLPALETSILLLVQPILSVVWARALFAEFLSPVQWLGMFLVLGGVSILSIRGSVEIEENKEAVKGGEV